MTERYADVWLIKHTAAGRTFKAIMMPEGEVQKSVTQSIETRQRGNIPLYDVEVELLSGEQIIYEANDLWVAEWTNEKGGEVYGEKDTR